MPLAVFDVTKNYAKIGELFDSSKKYVYKDPGNGVLAAPVREPASSSIYLYSGEYYWREFVNYAGWGITTVKWLDTVESVAGTGASSFSNFGSPFEWLRGSLQDSVTTEEGEVVSLYSVARYVSTNRNVLRMPNMWTMYNSGNSLTYSFDGETYTVGPSPPALPSVGSFPRLFYLGVI